jgi:hypothetical protein
VATTAADGSFCRSRRRVSHRPGQAAGSVTRCPEGKAQPARTITAKKEKILLRKKAARTFLSPPSRPAAAAGGRPLSPGVTSAGSSETSRVFTISAPLAA